MPTWCPPRTSGCRAAGWSSAGASDRSPVSGGRAPRRPDCAAAPGLGPLFRVDDSAVAGGGPASPPTRLAPPPGARNFFSPPRETGAGHGEQTPRPVGWTGCRSLSSRAAAGMHPEGNRLYRASPLDAGRPGSQTRGLTIAAGGVTWKSRLERRPEGRGFVRVRSLRTQQRAESQCQVIPRAGSSGSWLGFLWLIDIESVSSRFSALIKSSTESLILAQDERWRRA